MFELGLNLGLGHILAYIERTLAGACETLFADIFALVGLLLVKTFAGLDCQIAVLKGGFDLVFAESGQIHFKDIFAVCFSDVGFH